MNSSTITFLSCLLVLCAQGMPDSRSRKCKCLNGYIGQVTKPFIRQHIKSEPVIHQKNSFCNQMEIIITIKDEEKCVDPMSQLGKLILMNKKKQENKRRVIMTTSSSQTNTLNSTSGRITDSAPAAM
ncbi:C-X-C motif chemokine 10-like [Paralichthys olivaceus]|uniref:C-X-C motif chemokine 10-like n=1 Tax=Paralichthys olivaceus TaxID=8255 RepID=UPI0037514B72